VGPGVSAGANRFLSAACREQDCGSKTADPSVGFATSLTIDMCRSCGTQIRRSVRVGDARSGNIRVPRCRRCAAQGRVRSGYCASHCRGHHVGSWHPGLHRDRAVDLDRLAVADLVRVAVPLLAG
jgi:hypothetical protein